MAIATNSPLPVLLTRHGASEHNLNTQFYTGRSPASRLTDEGRAQARALGSNLVAHHAVSRIVASSLPRTMETAELVASTLGQVPVHAEDAFWELSKGNWEGRMPRDAVPEPERSEWELRPYRFCFPNGESFADVAQRAVPAFHRWLATYPQDHLLFVLHGDVICALLQQLLHVPENSVRTLLVKPCSLTELAPTETGWRMLRFSEVGFLGTS
jgi:broad specificity phosphatase PhoE